MEYSYYDIINILDDSIEDVVIEGAVNTSKKYRLDNYLKKYGYTKSTQTNIDGKDYESGYIRVNGVKYRVIRGYEENAAKIYNGIPTIFLNNDFGKLKNTDRMDAVLLHEIGHLKNHDADNRNASRAGHNAIDDYLGYKRRHDESTFTDKEKRQKANHEIYKQYEPNKKDFHNNRREYEADTYATTNQGTNKHMTKAARELYKKEAKREKPNVDAKDYHEWNQEVHDEMKARSKAIKDKRIDRSVYKENTYDTLIDILDI